MDHGRWITLFSKISWKTSFDFANDFVLIISENIQEPAEVSGKIIAPRDFKNELDLDCKFSKRGKLYTAELKKLELSPDQLKDIYEKFKQDFLLLSINTCQKAAIAFKKL